MLVVCFTISFLKYNKIIPFMPFWKNKYISATEISSHSPFVMLSIATQLKACSFKLLLGNSHNLSYYFQLFQTQKLATENQILSTSRDNLWSFSCQIYPKLCFRTCSYTCNLLPVNKLLNFSLQSNFSLNILKSLKNW